jgi:histidyl-tRNA synthetase
MVKNMRKSISIPLNEGTIRDLNSISRSMGMSRSNWLENLINNKLIELKKDEDCNVDLEVLLPGDYRVFEKKLEERRIKKIDEIKETIENDERLKGIGVIDKNKGDFKGQLQIALNNGSRYIIIIPTDIEKGRNMVTLKNMIDGSQEMISFEKLVKKLQVI